MDCTVPQPMRCVPGATQKCSCLKGGEPIPGVQSCAEGGLRWKTCECPNKRPSKEPATPSEPPTREIRTEPTQEPTVQDASEPTVTTDASEPSVEVGPEKEPDRPPLERLKIDLWPWGATAAVSLTIDDGLRAPFEKLVPEIESRGWRSTLFICTEMATQVGTWPFIKRAHSKGHEIGSHTHTHRNMAKLDKAELIKEFETSIQELQKNVDWKLPLLSFAYPYESMGKVAKSLVWDYHRYARGGDQGVDVPPAPVPLNDAKNPDFQFLQAKAPTHKFSVKQWNSWVTEAVKQGKWFIEEYHGVDGKEWEPRTMDEFRAHFDHIESFGRKIWVAPVARVGNYIDERQTAKFKIIQWSSKTVLLELKDSFSTKHNTPLTFTFEPPKAWGWTQIKVVQDGKVLRNTLVRSGVFRTEGHPEPTHLIRITPL